MNRSKLLTSIFSLLVFLFAGGCSTSASKSAKVLLPRHPFNETRMAAEPGNGYVSSGVWRIRGEENTVYLAGTCHLINEDQIPFPSPYYAAYNDSKIVYFEFDTHSTFNQLRLAPRAFRWTFAHRNEFICPRGRTLASYLKPETVERLESVYGKKNFQKQQKYTPLFLLFMNEFEDMQQGGEATSGVDDIFEIAAKRDHKPIRTLDDRKIMDTAMLALDEMLEELRRDIDKRGPDAVIAENIFGEGENVKKPDEDLDKDWRRGDVAQIEKLQDDLKKESPAFYKDGLVERNHKWLPAIKDALHSKQNIMILVGIAHLPGPDGLLELLTREGYHPEQLYGLDRP